MDCKEVVVVMQNMTSRSRGETGRSSCCQRWERLHPSPTDAE